MDDIAICPFCNYAFPNSEINKHADDHFSDAVEADRLVALHLQQKFDAEARGAAPPPLPDKDKAAADLKKALQDKLRGFRAQEDAEVARKLQEEYDKANRGMGPAQDYLPRGPIDPGALVVPDTWTLTPTGYALRCIVPKGSKEFDSVVGPMVATLGGSSSPSIRRVERIQNPATWAKYAASRGGHEAYFYHGCRGGMDSEIAIVRGGFNVNKCVSGGANYGTWFAYNSSYSCGGFAFVDESSATHLFVCQVLTQAPVMHQPGTMIVVGQDRAYPSYLVVFDAMAPGIRPTPVVSRPPPRSFPVHMARHLQSKGYGVFDDESRE